MSSNEIIEKLGINSRISFIDNYLNSNYENGLIAITNLDKITRNNQMYYAISSL